MLVDVRVAFRFIYTLLFSDIEYSGHSTLAVSPDLPETVLSILLMMTK